MIAELINEIYSNPSSGKVRVAALEKLLSKQYVYNLRNNFKQDACGGFDPTFAIKMGSYLINKSETESFLYDASIDFCSLQGESSKDYDIFVGRVLNFIESHPLETFLGQAADALMAAENVQYNYILRRVIASVLDLYCKECLVGTSFTIDVTTATLKPSVFLGAFIATEEQRIDYYKSLPRKELNRISTVGMVHIASLWSKKEYATVLSKLYMLYPKLVRTMTTIDVEEVSDMIACAIDSATYNLVDSVFCDKRWEGGCRYFPRYYVVSGLMSGEKRGSSQSAFEWLITKTLYDYIGSVGVDLLKYRRVFIREKGVVINLDESFGDVSQIILQEWHNVDEDKHWLRVVYLAPVGGGTTDSAHGFTINMKNALMSGSFYGSSDVSVFLAVLHWLGIEFDSYLADDLFIKNNKIVSDYSDGSILTSIHERAITAMHPDNLRYEEPVSWNVTDGSSIREPNKTGVYFYEKKKVGRYTRRLPAGEQPSAAAIALAKKVFIELKPGYTLVDSFERNQRVKAVDTVKPLKLED